MYLCLKFLSGPIFDLSFFSFLDHFSTVLRGFENAACFQQIPLQSQLLPQRQGCRRPAGAAAVPVPRGGGGDGAGRW